MTDDLNVNFLPASTTNTGYENRLPEDRTKSSRITAVSYHRLRKLANQLPSFCYQVIPLPPQFAA